MKILRLYFRDAIFHDSRESLDGEAQKAEFAQVPGGIAVKRLDGASKHPIVFVPWTNIKMAHIEPDADGPQFAKPKAK